MKTMADAIEVSKVPVIISHTGYTNFKLSAVILILIICAPLQSAENPLVNVDKKGVAIKDYDPVAYHTLGKPVPGTEEYSLLWSGATWLI